jgi:ribonuclease P protein subunit RPR2
MRRNPRQSYYKRIARERIEILLDLAKKELDKNPERSRRYVQLARKIGLRYNIRFSKFLKRMFCKKCNTLLIPGKTSIVRTNSKERTVRVKCINCGKYYRYPLKIKNKI